MPLHRRLPKRGFHNPFPTDYNEVNLGRIQQAVDAGKLDASAVVTQDALLSAGVISKPRDGVKILGQGALSAKLAFEVAAASKGAIAAIEGAGGSVKLLAAAGRRRGSVSRRASASPAIARARRMLTSRLVETALAAATSRLGEKATRNTKGAFRLATGTATG